MKYVSSVSCTQCVQCTNVQKRQRVVECVQERWQMSQTRLYSGLVFSGAAAAVQGSTGRERKPANIRTLHPTACFIAAGIVRTRIVGGGAAPALPSVQLRTRPPPPLLASSLLFSYHYSGSLILSLTHSRVLFPALVKVDSICYASPRIIFNVTDKCPTLLSLHTGALFYLVQIHHHSGRVTSSALLRHLRDLM